MAGVRRFQDLVAWRVSAELRDLVYALTDGGAGERDERFVRQIRASAASAPANLSEGFVRYSPRDFARFANIAKASLAETQNHLEHARAAGYITVFDYAAAFRLSCRALAATTRLHRYLLRCAPR